MAITAKVHEALVSRVASKQPAIVKCGSFPDRLLKAHVDQVATVAAVTDFWASDVKVYNTKVAIDEFLQGLKPGMTAEVTITTGATKEHVLTVPVQAVIGGAEMAGKRQVFVMNGRGADKRDIEIGESNDKMVEVKSGLKEGDEVVINPKVLLGDEKVKTREAGNGKPTENGESAPKAEQPKAGGAGKGPAGGPGGGPGGPGAGPGAGGAGPGGPGSDSKKGGPGGFKADPDMQKKMQEFDEKMKKGSAQERKTLLEQIPESFRDQVKKRYKDQGLQIAD
jgi:hypothetical protein